MFLVWMKRLAVPIAFSVMVSCSPKEEEPPIRQPPRQPPRVVKRKAIEETPPPAPELETASPTPKKLEEIPVDSVMARALNYFQRNPDENLRELKINELLGSTREEDLEIIRKALLTGEAQRCRAAISLLVGYYVSKDQLDKVDEAYQRFFGRCDPAAQDPRDWVAHSRSLLLAGLPQRALTQVNEAEKQAPRLPRGVDLMTFQAEILEIKARSYEGLFKSSVTNFEEGTVVRNHWTNANINWTNYKGLFEEAAEDSADAAARVKLAEEHISWLEDQQL